jgi:hypothetical protein
MHGEKSTKGFQISQDHSLLRKLAVDLYCLRLTARCTGGTCHSALLTLVRTTDLVPEDLEENTKDLHPGAL